eukprot:gene4599-9136_t
MSRHRNFRTFDANDYCDDYDDDYYDEGYNDSYNESDSRKQSNVLNFSNILPQNDKKKTNNSLKTKNDQSKLISDNDEASIVQIMEALGGFDISVGGRVTKSGVSETRIRQIFKGYDCDTERTLNYFLDNFHSSPANEIKSLDVSSPSTEMSKKSVTNKPVSLSADKSTVFKFAKNGQKLVQTDNTTQKTPSISTVKSSISVSKTSLETPKKSNKVDFKEQNNSQETQDLQGMGFNFTSPSAHTHAITPNQSHDNANKLLTLTDHMSSPLSDSHHKVELLSDDEYDTSTSTSNDTNTNAATSHRPHLTMVVAGHVDAGKSTLVGNLLVKLGTVSQRTIHKYERDSKISGKSSFYLAWVMDEDPSEREHGDFIPNMITGATQADVAILVIPAAVGEFESSMGAGAQTREHAVLLKALGVNQILVAVNKMDMSNPSWSQSRFDQVQTQVSALLTELQFPQRAVRFIPLSGLTGENLSELSEDCALRQWYTGPSLVQALDSFHVPPRQLDKPLRAVITNVIHQNAKSSDVSVRVLQGRLRRDRKVAVVGDVHRIEKVQKIQITTDDSGESGDVNQMEAGEEGTVTLGSRTHAEESVLRAGMVLCKGPPLLVKVTSFPATILTMTGLMPPIIPGSSFELYLHGEEVQCHIRKISSMMVLGKTKTEVIKKPKCVPGGRSAAVIIETVIPVCLEPFSDCKALGRFALRAKGKTCAVGICDK